MRGGESTEASFSESDWFSRREALLLRLRRLARRCRKTKDTHTHFRALQTNEVGPSGLPSPGSRTKDGAVAAGGPRRWL